MSLIGEEKRINSKFTFRSRCSKPVVHKESSCDVASHHVVTVTDIKLMPAASCQLWGMLSEMNYILAVYRSRPVDRQHITQFQPLSKCFSNNGDDAVTRNWTKRDISKRFSTHIRTVSEILRRLNAEWKNKYRSITDIHHKSCWNYKRNYSVGQSV